MEKLRRTYDISTEADITDVLGYPSVDIDIPVPWYRWCMVGGTVTARFVGVVLSLPKKVDDSVDDEISAIYDVRVLCNWSLQEVPVQ